MSNLKLTKEDKDILIELICNEQLYYLVTKNKYESKKYNKLEQLKIKIKELWENEDE